MRCVGLAWGHFLCCGGFPFAPLALRLPCVKVVLQTTDPTVMAFARALFAGEGIDCFEMDVNMSVLEGGIGILPRRLMVRTSDYTQARRILEDNGMTPTGE